MKPNRTEIVEAQRSRALRDIATATENYISATQAVNDLLAADGTTKIDAIKRLRALAEMHAADLRRLAKNGGVA